jgi:multidrug efflux pump subunit AcrA (membrane-fusion protein)
MTALTEEVPSRQSRRRLIVVGAVVAIGVLAVAATQLGGGSPNPQAAARSATTVSVVTTDVAETTPVNGTVGFASPSSVVEPAGVAASALTKDQQAVAAAAQNLAADRQAQADAQAQAASGQQKAVQTTHQAQAKLASDASAVANAQAAQTADQAAAAAYDLYSKYTALPTVGQVIAPGQALWSVDGKPVPLLVGSLTPWRAFAAGMSPGADVAALNHALIALGMGAGLSDSDAFTAATATAIIRLQASLGLPQTGTLALGAVVFEPTEIRVTTVHPQAGATVAGGAAVLDVTSTNPIVNVALSVSQTYLVKTGDAVRVTLPDGTATSGTVTAVGKVATPSSDNSTATVNVTIALEQASASGSLDKAPVSVSITNRSAHQVLAVPTTALLALAGGGDAVEVVDPNGSHRLVGVTTGIFDSQSGLVEVSGSGLSAGLKVVAAA